MVAVTSALGTAIKRRGQGMVEGEFDDYWPRVAVSYGTGHRTGKDGLGCGTGMVYAAVSGDVCVAPWSVQCDNEEIVFFTHTELDRVPEGPRHRHDIRTSHPRRRR